MMIRKFKRVVVAASMLSVLPMTSACAAGGPDLLSYIPADSPYVVAMTEPFPAELMEKMEPATDQVLRSYQTIIRYAMNEELAKMEQEEDAESAQKFRGLMDEITGLLSLEGLRAAGIESDSLVALYGYGLLPVFRAELSDESLFDDVITRIEAKVDNSLENAKAGSADYKYAEFENIRFIVATLDDQLVITVAPTAFDEDRIAEMLGATKPRNSIKRARTLRQIRKDYDYAGYMTGYIDNVAIANAFLGDRSDADQALFDAFAEEGEPQEEISATCKSEYLDLVRIAPRMVFGYSAVNNSILDSSFVIEMREDIATGLATLPAVVPGLGHDPGGLMSFGMSLNPMALSNFVEARLDAMEAEPFACEQLVDTEIAVTQGREALAQPIPPIVYDIRGFVANIADVEGMDLANDIPPTSIDATMLFAIENAQALVMMGAMFDPEIAALNLLPDGKAVELKTAQVAATVGQAFAAMTDNALSLSVGEGAEQNAAAMLGEDGSDPAPFMSFAMDSARYYAMIGDAIMQEQSDEHEEEMPLEVREAIKDLVMAAGGMYDRMAVDIRFTSRGVELDGRVTLAE